MKVISKEEYLKIHYGDRKDLKKMIEYEQDWKEAWEENKERLINMLNVHHFPESEKKKVLATFEVGVANKDASNMIRCIDFSLNWFYSRFSYDFYYFLQMRFAYYMCFYAHTQVEKIAAAEYLGYLAKGYSSTPQWEYRYKKDIILAKAASQQGDLILTQMDYNLRKAFFKERYNFFAEKFGIKG